VPVRAARLTWPGCCLLAGPRGKAFREGIFDSASEGLLRFLASACLSLSHTRSRAWALCVTYTLHLPRQSMVWCRLEPLHPHPQPRELTQAWLASSLLSSFSEELRQALMLTTSCFSFFVWSSLLLTLRRLASEDQNPFSKWSFVVIPDCTGDQHIGNRSYTYDAGDGVPLTYWALLASRRPQRVRLAAMPAISLPITASPCIAHREADAKRQPRAGKESCITVHHRGGVNTGMAMDWLFDSFPVLEEVMVIGAPINKDAAADGSNPLFKRYADFKLSPYSHATGSEGAAFWGKYLVRTVGS
jgi:hypothetical protein